MEAHGKRELQRVIGISGTIPRIGQGPVQENLLEYLGSWTAQDLRLVAVPRPAVVQRQAAETGMGKPILLPALL